MEPRIGIRAALVVGLIAALSWVIAPKVMGWHVGGSGDSVEILVASHYLPAFTPVKKEDVRLDEVPKHFLPPGALRSLPELQNENGQYIYLSAVAIPEGQQLTRTVLVNAEQGESLASFIRPGRVAVSFEVDRAHGVGGWIKPGDTIAIYRSAGGLPQKNEATRMTQLLFQSVPVLAVDATRLGAQDEKPASSDADVTAMPAPTGDSKILTVLVSPSEASAIVEAREHGSLDVVLRAVGDDLPWPTTN